MKYLVDLRSSKKLSCREMANMLGISKTYYWQLENNFRRLSYDMAIKISSIFNKKPDDIFYDYYTKKIKE